VRRQLSELGGGSGNRFLISTASNSDIRCLKAITLLCSDLPGKTAQSKNYAIRVSLPGYEESANAQWASEVTSFLSWRDNVRQYICAAGKNRRQERSSISDLYSEIQAIWPS